MENTVSATSPKRLIVMTISLEVILSYFRFFILPQGLH
jgi:hypothetical protein